MKNNIAQAEWKSVILPEAYHLLVTVCIQECDEVGKRYFLNPLENRQLDLNITVKSRKYLFNKCFKNQIAFVQDHHLV